MFALSTQQYTPNIRHSHKHLGCRESPTNVLTQTIYCNWTSKIGNESSHATGVLSGQSGVSHSPNVNTEWVTTYIQVLMLLAAVDGILSWRGRRDIHVALSPSPIITPCNQVHFQIRIQCTVRKQLHERGTYSLAITDTLTN